jgi:glycosyltransferase involved in cell wall biosynthesis
MGVVARAGDWRALVWKGAIIGGGGVPMHIAINGLFWGQPMVGSGQYLDGLLAALLECRPDLRVTLLVPQRSEPSRPTPPAVNRVALATPFDGRSENLAKLWFEQVAVPRAAGRVGADVLHVPYFAPPLWSPVPMVASILDIIPLILPEYRGSRAVRAYMRVVARAARGARHVLTLSEHSRRDIERYLGIPHERITPTPLAVGPHFVPPEREAARAEVLQRYGLREPFVYYVGGLDVRKNVPMLIRAFARLRRAGGPAGQLVIAGRALGDNPQLFPDLDAVIAEEQAQEWVRRIEVPHADSALLYAAATVFAWPSRYEGFGLPPLEAMSCGTPCVVADASSLPEVVGDAALRVPPDDVEGWVAALWRLLGDAELRADQSRRGLQQAAQFRYSRVARQTLAVYEKVVG